MQDEFYRDKTVLVTGGSGFLGKNVVDLLTNMGVHVTAPSHHSVDLLNGTDVRRMLKAYSPDIVIHLAANVGGIGANLSAPADMFYDNAMMGLNIIHESNLSGVEKVVYVGTVCSYPKFTTVPMMEEDFWEGYPEETNAPYAIAKKMMLTGLQAYRQQYGLNGVYLVMGNLYGPGDNFDPQTSHVIPAIIRKIDRAIKWEDDTVELWGDGTATRDFLYVTDAARAICLATEQYNNPEPLNIGSGYEVSIRDVAEYIALVMGYSGGFTWDNSKPNGQPRRVLATGRAISEIDFVNEVSFNEGIRSTVAWYANRSASASDSG